MVFHSPSIWPSLHAVCTSVQKSISGDDESSLNEVALPMLRILPLHAKIPPDHDKRNTGNGQYHNGHFTK